MTEGYPVIDNNVNYLLTITTQADIPYNFSDHPKHRVLSKESYPITDEQKQAILYMLAEWKYQ